MVGNRPPMRALVVPILQAKIDILSKQCQAILEMNVRV